MERSEFGLARYINHSRATSQLNLKPKLVVDDYELCRVCLFSTRDIEAGEELFFDYGDRRAKVLQDNPWLRKK